MIIETIRNCRVLYYGEYQNVSANTVLDYCDEDNGEGDAYAQQLINEGIAIPYEDDLEDEQIYDEDELIDWDEQDWRAAMEERIADRIAEHEHEMDID